MSAIIDSLKNAAGNIFYPKTKTKAVYDDNNNRLDHTLEGINNSLNTLKGKMNEGAISVSSFDTLFDTYKTGLFSVFINGDGDYFVIQIYRTANLGVQIRIKLGSGAMQKRVKNTTWSAWSALS